LQCPQSNINESLDVLSELVKFLSAARSDEAFNKYIRDAKVLAAEVNVVAEFPVVRSRTKVHHFDDESPDEQIIYPKELFRIQIYLTIVDTALNSIQERFDNLNECNNVLKFLCESGEITEEEIKKSCFDLDVSLQINKGTTSIKDLFNELITYRILGSGIADPLKNLTYITKNNFMSSFLNLFIALRIFLTLPVSVASGERSFSKLKLIKPHLRMSMTQERFHDLGLLAIEKELANKKARRVQF
jgi:hypothetical protein